MPARCSISTATDSALIRAPARGPSGTLTKSTPRILSCFARSMIESTWKPRGAREKSAAGFFGLLRGGDKRAAGDPARRQRPPADDEAALRHRVREPRL